MDVHTIIFQISCVHNVVHDQIIRYIFLFIKNNHLLHFVTKQHTIYMVYLSPISKARVESSKLFCEYNYFSDK